MPNQIPRTRADWTAWMQAAEQKSPVIFCCGFLSFPAVLMIARYTLDELAYRPENSIWKSWAYWSGALKYAAIPIINWLVWKLLSGNRLKTLKPLLAMSVALCAGSALALSIPDLLRSIDHMHLVKFRTPVEKWHWSTFRFHWQLWTPIVLVIGNLILFRRWRRLDSNGRMPPSYAGKIPAPLRSRSRLFLKAAAFASATVACALTAFHLGLPRLPADEDVVSLARTFLVEPHLRADFDYLVQHSFASGQPLAPLLTHAKLADLQRRQFYPNLDETTFREYVLSPEIDPLPLNELNWRRTLWEHFYPRVRRETDPIEAARIIVRQLREQVGIDPGYDYRVGVETIWTQQMTDEAGFERIYVAALRSVGIASKLNASGQAELLEDNNWQPAPRPVVLTLLPKKFPVPDGGLINFRNWAGDDWPQ